MTDLEKQHTMESFWTMIRNDPKNDANRLVFGDWCEEHGENELAKMLRGGSEKWLRDLAESVDIGYGRLMRGAAEWVESQEAGTWGEYITGGESMEGESVPDEFWDHYRVMTGINVNEEHRGSFFSCAC